MSIDFSSYFVLGFFLILGIFCAFVVGDVFIFKTAFKYFIKFKKLTILLILSSVLATSLISASLIVNDSFIDSSQKYVEKKLGETDGIIHSRESFKTWDSKKANEVFSIVNEDFDSFLPIYYKLAGVKNEEKKTELNSVVIINFDPATASSYQKKSSNLNTDFDLKKDEIIISRSIANDLKLNESDNLIVNLERSPQLNLKIKSIVEDNGLIGFNAPLRSKFTLSKGSIYISNDLVKEIEKINNKSNEPTYNSLLVTREIYYNPEGLVKAVQKKLNNYDPNIVFEELKVHLYEATLGASNGITFGQILLGISILPILTSLILAISFLDLIIHERRKVLGVLSALGVSKFKLSKLIAFESFFYSTLGSIGGIALGIGIGAIFLNFITKIIDSVLADFELKNNIFLNINGESLIFAFAGAWMVLFLVFVLFSSKLADIDILEALTGKETYLRSKLNLKNGSTVLFISVIGLILIYYVSTGRFGNTSLKAYSVYFGILLTLWALSYLTKLINGKNFAFSFVSIITIVWTLLLGRISFFSNAWTEAPVLYFLNGIILILSLSTLIVLNIDKLFSWLNKIWTITPRLKLVLSFGMTSIAVKRFRSGVLITALSLAFFVIALFSIFTKQINQILESSYKEIGHDIAITDVLGVEDVSNTILDNKKDIPGFVEISEARIGAVTLPEFKYKDVPFYDPKAPLPIKPEDSFNETIQVVNEDFFNEDLKIKSRDALNASQNPKFQNPNPKENLKDQFLNSRSYVILGQNYFKEAGDLNVRPNLKPGDKLKISFPGNIVIERTILAIIEQSDGNGNTVLQSGTGLRGYSGILISQADYNSINKERNIFLPAVYGIKLDSKDRGIEAGEKIKTLLKSKNVSSIVVNQETVREIYNFVNQLVFVVFAFLTYSLMLLVLSGLVILTKNRLSNKDLFKSLSIFGLSKSMLQAFFVVENISIVLFSSMIGISAAIYSTYAFYYFGGAVKGGVNYSVPWVELGSVVVGAMVLSGVGFQRIKNKEQRIN